MSLIDSHCHWDASEFESDRFEQMRKAQALGVTGFVIPAVAPSNWATVADIARQIEGAYYTLGIHPVWIASAQRADIERLSIAIQTAVSDPKFLGVGEIGLDYFLSNLDRQMQWFFFEEQLRLARHFSLPVLLHIRRSQDMVLKGLRQFKVPGGIAHAFNGSDQQARQFVDLGFCLGFGGAMTFDRAKQIRRLAQNLPDHALVIETDAPDIPPAWINHQRNDSTQLPGIAQCLADLRSCTFAQISELTSQNTLRVLPRMLPRVMPHVVSDVLPPLPPPMLPPLLPITLPITVLN